LSSGSIAEIVRDGDIIGDPVAASIGGGFRGAQRGRKRLLSWRIL